MEKKALYEDAPMRVQKNLLFFVLSAELAVCHLLAAGVIHMMDAGVSGFMMMMPFLATIMVGVVVVASNIASLIISARLLWFEKDAQGWEPLAKIAFPAVLLQTSFMVPVWLLFDIASVQFTVGCVGLMLTGISLLFLRRSVQDAKKTFLAEEKHDA